MKNSKLFDSSLETSYRSRHAAALKPIADALQRHIAEILEGQPRIDRITARPKDPASFLKKARKESEGIAKYSEPLSQIQDQIGARIIVFYKSDVERIKTIIKAHFRTIEDRHHVPESEWEFGYFGHHYVSILPSDVIDPSISAEHIPEFFELQIKTLFEHAWSEAEHDLGYKEGDMPLTSDQKRKLAYTSAQAWGADEMFNSLFAERRGTAENPTRQSNTDERSPV